MKRKYIDPTEEERAAILAQCLKTNPLARAALTEILRARMAPAIPSRPGAQRGKLGGIGRRSDRKLVSAMAGWR